MKSKRLFHYTVGTKIPLIQKDGFIKRADAFVSKNELPAVWCTFNSEWEETANKMFQSNYDNVLRAGNREQTEEIGGGLYRIEVSQDAAPLDWKQFKKRSGIKKNMSVALEKIARNVGSSVSDWRASFEPIYSDKWISIEFLEDGEWISVWNPAIAAVSEKNDQNLTLH